MYKLALLILSRSAHCLDARPCQKEHSINYSDASAELQGTGTDGTPDRFMGWMG